MVCYCYAMKTIIAAVATIIVVLVGAFTAPAPAPALTAGECLTMAVGTTEEVVVLPDACGMHADSEGIVRVDGRAYVSRDVAGGGVVWQYDWVHHAK